MNRREELAAILASARMHLEMEQAMGVSRVPFDELRAKRLRDERKSKPKAISPAKGSKAAQLDEIRKELLPCCQCGLGKTRTNLVFGDGNPDADLMFIGEAPGEDEDLQGVPFVGRAGQLLTQIIEAMGLKRSEVYIANICKCRPPDNRNPAPDESSACLPYLLRQIEIIQPKIIVTLGNVPTQTLLKTDAGITKIRGQFHEWNGIEIMPTFHPSYLLRSPSQKRPVWEDMQKVHARMRELGCRIGELKSGKHG